MTGVQTCALPICVGECVFVNLSEGVDGFIPAQLASKDFVKNLNDRFKAGATRGKQKKNSG